MADTGYGGEEHSNVVNGNPSVNVPKDLIRLPAGNNTNNNNNNNNNRAHLN